MSEQAFEVRAAGNDYEFSIRLAVITRDSDGVRSGYAAPVSIVPCGPGDLIQPTAEVSREAARKLMDDLWTIGIRPTEFRHTDAAMSASAAHLQDMRAIAFSKLDIPKP